VTAPGKAGHAAVFAEVVRQRGLIRAVLRRSGVSPCDLDDLEQSCVFTAWRRIQDGAFNPLDPSKPLAENVAAWIAGIARWTAIEHKRKRARYAKVFGQHTSEQSVDRDAIQVPGPEAELLAREELAALGRMKMSPKQREVVRLTALGFTAREIGERLGIPEETAASCVKRARASYKKQHR
jgi:RNA polymerase sigma factor (sigma-70 family)